VSSRLWRHGPDCLVDITFSAEEDELCMTEECTTEVKVTLLTVTDDLCNVGKIIDCNKFSQLCHLLKVIAYVIKFAKAKGTTVEHRTKLTADEVARAEDLWV